MRPLGEVSAPDALKTASRVPAALNSSRRSPTILHRLCSLQNLAKHPVRARGVSAHAIWVAAVAVSQMKAARAPRERTAVRMPWSDNKRTSNTNTQDACLPIASTSRRYHPRRELTIFDKVSVAVRRFQKKGHNQGRKILMKTTVFLVVVAAAAILSGASWRSGKQARAERLRSRSCLRLLEGLGCLLPVLRTEDSPGGT